ncbi:hypothetical protein KPATCC21470_7382 [Kitasatospora purpeofusca]
MRGRYTDRHRAPSLAPCQRSFGGDRSGTSECPGAGQWGEAARPLVSRSGRPARVDLDRCGGATECGLGGGARLGGPDLVSAADRHRC